MCATDLGASAGVVSISIVPLTVSRTITGPAAAFVAPPFAAAPLTGGADASQGQRGHHGNQKPAEATHQTPPGHGKAHAARQKTTAEFSLGAALV